MKNLFFGVLLILATSPVSAATLTITIPNAVVDRSTAAFCGTYNYATTAKPGETPIQFSQRMVAEFIKNVVITFEVYAAEKNQSTQTNTDVGGIQ